jgi:hypothetical protein
MQQLLRAEGAAQSAGSISIKLPEIKNWLFTTGTIATSLIRKFTTQGTVSSAFIPHLRCFQTCWKEYFAEVLLTRAYSRTWARKSVTLEPKYSRSALRYWERSIPSSTTKETVFEKLILRKKEIGSLMRQSPQLIATKRSYDKL